MTRAGIAALVSCFAIASACSRQGASGHAAPVDPSVRTTECSPAQHADLQRALESICREVSRPGGECQNLLAQVDALESFERQCRRGIIVRCTQALCGQYLPKYVFRSDAGTIEMGLGGLYGGAGCGGRDRPMLGPNHTLAHEMAHAAGLRADRHAEQVAYSCRGGPSVE